MLFLTAENDFLEFKDLMMSLVEAHTEADKKMQGIWKRFFLDVDEWAIKESQTVSHDTALKNHSLTDALYAKVASRVATCFLHLPVPCHKLHAFPALPYLLDFFLHCPSPRDFGGSPSCVFLLVSNVKQFSQWMLFAGWDGQSTSSVSSSGW